MEEHKTCWETTAIIKTINNGGINVKSISEEDVEMIQDIVKELTWRLSQQQESKQIITAAKIESSWQGVIHTEL